MAFDLLSEPIRRYIRDKRWEQLRPIQVAAITRIMSSNENFILASKTSSGKTEAAFLPILSKVDFNQEGVQVVYISPLIALINDQFYRVEDLCKYLDITVTKWHGEANKTQKQKLLNNANGIVLITPESIEAMFINKPYNIKKLFSNLKYVVIDEIHSFLGTARGLQLKSILSRLQKINSTPYKIIGLSATIGDYDEAKKFTGDELNTKILLDKSKKDINAIFRYFENKTEELPFELLEELYKETQENKILIFPNSRGRAEEVAVKLKRIAEKKKGHLNYFSHHSSVHKDVREYIEFFAKNNFNQNFAISCTSTLELGIDIGTVDEVVQIDTTNSIASLIQRIGRSGRKEGKASNLILYATSKWSLLQSIACWLLYKDGFIEPPKSSNTPYDILIHQCLSIVKASSGIKTDELLKQLKENTCFKLIPTHEIEDIVHYLIQTDILEKLRAEIIIGIEGEKIVNGREFYSVFITEENYKVINAGSTIGEIPYSPQIREDENILLAAKIWKIIAVDHDSKKIEVKHASDGKKPFFGGGTGDVHNAIRLKMLDILFSDEIYDFLDDKGKLALNEMRQDFSVFNITETDNQRPLLVTTKNVTLFTFSGTRINNSLVFLLDIAGIKPYRNEPSSSIEIEIHYEEFKDLWQRLNVYIDEIDSHISSKLQTNPAIIGFTKWGYLLPLKYQIRLLKQEFFDFDNVSDFLSLNLTSNTPA